ncbi:unnamed protein product [Chondrus crispus]|uniref:Uncharacterized protein n=1 Tax=Chondrus crispus TaxID=2769 RepID=R7QDQ4_CHOCR|nr:unnamed protein product [Chondrus crispus]CDF35545.1 unnamed protein product [Chondrus crispus]|eukprot:XP_005715364.1 unnamed protein product [Chondrus crispus]
MIAVFVVPKGTADCRVGVLSRAFVGRDSLVIYLKGLFLVLPAHALDVCIHLRTCGSSLNMPMKYVSRAWSSYTYDHHFDSK